MLPRVVLLYLPATILALFLVAFVLFCAFPLSFWGAPFDNQPDYLAGYANQFLLAVVPLWYLISHSLLSVWPAPRPWVRGVAALAVAGVAFASAFGTAFAAGMSGGRTALGWPGLPLVAFDKIAYLATTPLRDRHYLRHLDDPDERSRHIASWQVHEIVYERWIAHDRPVPARVQRSLARALRSPDEEVRKDCGERLASCAPWTDEAVGLALEALGDPDPRIRADTARFFGTTYDKDERLVARLLDATERDGDAAVREAAAQTLDRIARDDPRFERAVLLAIDRGEPFGAVLLHTIRPDDPRVLAAFATFLADPDPKVRRAWIEAIGNVSSQADDFFDPKGFRPQIVKTIKAADKGQLDGRAALLRACKDPDAGVREAAARKVAETYPDDAGVLRALARALSDPDEKVRHAAISHLYEAKPQDVEVQVAMARALADPDRSVRWLAAAGLAASAPADRKVQLELVRALRADTDPSSETRMNVGEALVSAKPADPVVIAGIAALLGERSLEVRGTAAEVLGKLRTHDTGAQRALARALRDHDRRDEYEPSIGQRAADALAECTPISAAARADLEAIAAGGDAEAARLARTVLSGKREGEAR